MTAKDLLNQAMTSNARSLSAATVAATDCTIDPETREIQFVNSELLLGVESDEKSERISFSCPKIVGDNIDLTKLSLRVNFQNANSEKDQYIIEDTKDAADGNITFSWLLSRKVTMYKGKVHFIICAVRTSDGVITNEWNTTLAEANVLEGLEIGDVPIPQPEQDVITQLLQLMNASKDAAQASAEEAARTVENGRLQIQQSVDSAVQQIQSRVDVYTQQETHDRFALALVTKTGPASSLEVYPDKLSNLKVYANGFTQQSGTSDPSPTNVREILVGGMQANLFPGFTQLASRNLETGELQPNSDGNVSSDLFTCKANQDYYVSVKRDVISSLRVCFWDSDETFLQSISIASGATNPSGSFKSPTNAAKMAVSAYSLGGNLENYTEQLVVYGTTTVPYTPYTGAKYGAVIQIEGGEYRDTCLPLTAPLCEGDSVVSWVKSGCDKVVTFDGSSDEQITIEGTMSGGYVRAVVQAPGMLGNADPGNAFVTNWVPVVADYDGAYTHAYNASKRFYLFLRADNVQGVRNILSERPLTVWYATANYTPAVDIPVSLETHVQGTFELDGTEDGTFSSTYNAMLVRGSKMPGPCKGKTESGISSIAKMEYLTAGSGFYYDPNSTSLWFGTKYAAQFENSYEAFQAKLAELYEAGTPAQFVYPLSTPITYAHPAVVLPALPDDTGKVTITGQSGGTVTVVFNKSLVKAFEELQAAVLAAVAKLSM